MRKATRRLVEQLSLEFLVLYRQFLLRVVDLEALSIEADIPRFLGQFAGILILISAFQTLGFLYASGRPHLSRSGLLNLAMHSEQSLIAGTMLIAGLVAVATWDNIFPDRRDAMVLGPLPVRPRTILAAKLAAAGSLLGIGVLALNLGMGVALPLVTGAGWRFPRVFIAYWFTVVSAAAFVYGAVLAVQGVMAVLLSRRWFLRLSAILQLAAFALFLSAWLFQPSFGSAEEMAWAQRHGVLARWPAFWFFGLFGQMSGVFPFMPGALALRAWLALAAAGLAAGTSLLLCYVRHHEEDSRGAGSDAGPQRTAMAVAARRQSAYGDCAFQYAIAGPEPSTSCGIRIFSCDCVCYCCLDADQCSDEPPYAACDAGLFDKHADDALPGSGRVKKYLLAARVAEGKLGAAGNATGPAGKVHRGDTSRDAGYGHGSGVADGSRTGALLSALAPGSGASAGARAGWIDHHRHVPDRRVEDSFRLLLPAGKVECAICVLGICCGIYAAGDELLAL
jgi:hypothetical protein